MIDFTTWIYIIIIMPIYILLSLQYEYIIECLLYVIHILWYACKILCKMKMLHYIEFTPWIYIIDSHDIFSGICSSCDVCFHIYIFSSYFQFLLFKHFHFNMQNMLLFLFANFVNVDFLKFVHLESLCFLFQTSVINKKIYSACFSKSYNLFIFIYTTLHYNI